MPSSRADQAAEAARLRAAGLKSGEIAERMGISRSWASDLLVDPTGARVRARKRSYSRRCEDCGKPTDGSNGPRKAPRRCARCFQARQRAETQAKVIEAIWRFHDRYGRPPSATDFNTSQARSRADQAWRAERFHRDSDYVHSSQLIAAFGSWNAALEAAGLDPRGQGEYEREPLPDDRPGATFAPYLEREREQFERDVVGAAYA